MVQPSVDNLSANKKREQVAFMIAKAFNDTGQINVYITYCKKYPLNIVSQAFSKAKNFPEEKIRKSRAAIFFYLLKTYAHESD